MRLRHSITTENAKSHKAVKYAELHSWDITPIEAIALQRELASRIVEKTPAGFSPRLIAAADISYNRFSTRFFAAIVVLSVPKLETVELRTAEGDATFPYIPGLLSFRELPILACAFSKIKSIPDAVLIDGHGRAHPRRFGIACHAGLLLGLPTVGCGKSLLVGEHGRLGARRGDHSDIIHNAETIGSALRTRESVKPVYVSVGNNISLEDARRLVLMTSVRARVPEPIRAAHNAANAARKYFHLN